MSIQAMRVAARSFADDIMDNPIRFHFSRLLSLICSGNSVQASYSLAGSLSEGTGWQFDNRSDMPDPVPKSSGSSGDLHTDQTELVFLHPAFFEFVTESEGFPGPLF